MNACLPRSPAAVDEQVRLIGVETNAELQPRDVTGDGKDETWCNVFVHMATTLLSAPVPRDYAYWQIEWLKGEGSATHGWRKVEAAVAVAEASRGCPVVVGWQNTTPALGKDGKQLRDHLGRPLFRPSHVALVRATPADGHGVYIAQAGLKNFSLGRLVDGFGTKAPLLWFAHA